MTAGATRKLQKEIETVLKKVEDGMLEFSDCWDQAQSASSSAQKDKLGEDLKKSINKLQRFRAQIREWIAQSGVPSGSKDKLEDARRRIEHDMQRFKDFERDLKTKAFSTCGLMREDDLDGDLAEKLKCQDWLSQTIQMLNDQLDQFEADLEALSNKKSLKDDDKSRQSHLRLSQERHRWHIKKLELILRALDNETLNDMSNVECIQDTVEYYLENNEDPGCYHDEELYDCFELAEVEEKAAKPTTPTAEAPKDAPGTPASSKEVRELKEAPGPVEPQKKAKEREKKRKEDKKDKKKDDKKATPSGTPVAASSTKAANGANGAKSPVVLSETDGKKTDPLRENLDPDEVKVQEDQLLGEAEEFICKICMVHVVGCSPKLTSCSHLFCGDCIAQWFGSHPESQTWAQRARSVGPERVVPCPVCKQPLNEKKDLYPVCGVTSRSENLLLWRMLSSLKIMCMNHPKVSKEGRCQWIGEYGSYQKHIAVCKNSDTILPEKPEASTPTAAPKAEAASEASSALPSKDVSRKCTPVIGASSPTAKSQAAPSPLPSPSLSPAPAGAAPASAAPAGAPAAPAKAARQPAAKPSPDHPPKGIAAAPSAAPTLPSTASPSTPAGAPPAPASPPSGGAGAPTRAPSTPASPAPSPAPTVPAAVAVAAAPQAAPRDAPAEPKTLSGGYPGTPQAASPTASAAVTAALNAAVNAAAPSSTPSAAPAGAQAAVNGRRPVQAEASQEDASFMAKATSAFEPTGASMIAVSAGDSIKVMEHHASGWTYAQNLSLSPPASGWVPSWVVQAVPPSDAKPKAAAQTEPAAIVAAPRTQQPTPAASQPAPAAQASPAPAPAPAPAVEVRAAGTRAVAGFAATSASQLTLQLGDLVEIVERHASGWTYGRKGESEGWFPDWVVSAQK